ncbi:Alkaline phosphatase H [Fundidesulfovibrio magnetotacticus]|uniref:Alkaline phosphatase H n=1 Tax=Fundidesulfovibrio magnetotacticus TaxID=2730080 RepID=A0A6V8LVW0_9BACT|nr:alkaline phosphatase [Fundidesulfovibrio magnetotacticus]GFK94731.1 Alkaline phosphatase H [Fundidesulfovibrio magnetotacticus]
MIRARSVVRRATLLLWLLLALAFAAQARAAQEPSSAKPAKYVFLFIGDGLAQAQRTAAEYYLAAAQGMERPGLVKLVMNGFPVHGATTTHSLNSVITDSGAAGTALASGVKSYNGAIGVDGERKPVKTLAEMARDKGMKVGVVSSVSLDHATPACFYAHRPSRNDYYEIGLAAPASGFNYFAGGGFKDPEGKKSKAEGPKVNIFEEFKAKGYTVANTLDGLKALAKGQDKVVALNPVLDADKALPYAMDADPAREFSLAQFTAKGIELLDNPNGFFLMVEGGKVDWACHANDAVASIQDTLALDQAVAAAVEFAARHPEETLIVVTGDHECGGMALGFAGTKYGNYYQYLKHQKLSFQAFDERLRQFRKDHPGDKATLEAAAPLIREGFGLVVPSAADIEAMKASPVPDENNTSPADSYGMYLKPFEVALVQDAFRRSMAGETVKSKDPAEYLRYGDYEPLTVTLTRILDSKAGLAWTTYSHTGMPVMTSARGAGERLFEGYYDNTELARRLMKVIDPAVQLATN